MKLKWIEHVAIICSDYEKSKDFYVNVLGLEVIKETFREEKKSYKLDLRVGGDYQIELFSFFQFHRIGHHILRWRLR